MPLLAGALVAAAPALAQQATATQPVQPAPKPGAPIETVTVTAVKQSNRIDRQVYDVKADPATSNIGYSDQSVLGRELPGDERRSAVSVTGRGRISYQMDANNLFAMSLNATGKQLFGEGYRKPTRTADLNYRRKVTQALNFVLNVNDVFDSQKMETVTETDRLREQSIWRFSGRTVLAGLSYRFGSFGGAGARGPGRPGPGGGGSGPRPPSSRRLAQLAVSAPRSQAARTT